MNVFMTTEEDFDGTYTLGIFSTFDLANSELKRRMNDRKRKNYGSISKICESKWVYTSTEYNYLVITKVKLDKGGNYG